MFIHTECVVSTKVDSRNDREAINYGYSRYGMVSQIKRQIDHLVQVSKLAYQSAFSAQKGSL